LEAVVDDRIWKGRRVFLTGHTGFKGSWLALWLADLGAEVTGFSLPAPTVPSLFERARIGEVVRHVEGDVRDAGAIEAAIAEARPDIVFHLAAQPLVRYSYDNPIETYATNVMGTAHLLDACRRLDSVRGVVCITTDKCYENREWVWPYRENDPMGGHDPYSSSKGAAELVISAYRRSYFDGRMIASVRAGNVIGGGDWAADRLVPDLVRAMEAGQRPVIRSPGSIRPWQHVLEALGGYLLIAGRMLAGDATMATAWNFGPADDDARPVGWIVERMLEHWGAPGWDRPDDRAQPHEANILRLDCSKARTELGWRPAMCLDDALRRVVDWHRAVSDGVDARDVTLQQITAYRDLSRAVHNHAKEGALK
jgi:CDP-glucose 4,6-dehydratase